MSYVNCPHPIYPHDDRHIASQRDDPSHPFTNDAGELFYLQTLVPICQGCGTPLNDDAAIYTGNNGDRWRSTIWLIEEEPF